MAFCKVIQSKPFNYKENDLVLWYTDLYINCGGDANLVAILKVGMEKILEIYSCHHLECRVPFLEGNFQDYQLRLSLETTSQEILEAILASFKVYCTFHGVKYSKMR